MPQGGRRCTREGNMIKVKHRGNFNHFEKFCNRALGRDYLNKLAPYCERGVAALKEATPSDSGETANAWSYEIENTKNRTKVWFTNGHEENGVNIAILLIYGHGTRNGGYVEGNDFVTPALKNTFQDLADCMWMELIGP